MNPWARARSERRAHLWRIAPDLGRWVRACCRADFAVPVDALLKPKRKAFAKCKRCIPFETRAAALRDE